MTTIRRVLFGIALAAVVLLGVLLVLLLSHWEQHNIAVDWESLFRVLVAFILAAGVAWWLDETVA